MLYQVQGAFRELYFFASFEEALFNLGVQVLTGQVNNRYPNDKKDGFPANVV